MDSGQVVDMLLTHDPFLTCSLVQHYSNPSYAPLHILGNLEYWNYCERPDYFAGISESEDELERMLAVLRWTCEYLISRVDSFIYKGILLITISNSHEGSQIYQTQGEISPETLVVFPWRQMLSPLIFDRSQSLIIRYCKRDATTGLFQLVN